MRYPLILAAAVIFAALAVGLVNARPEKPRPVLVEGKSIHWWAKRARQNKLNELGWFRVAAGSQSRAKVLRARLREKVAPAQHAYEHAATLAAVAYGVDAATLIRKGRCESANWTAFTNSSSGAAGPWQFLWSTWRSTPFGAHDPYDPLAAALAAAWMHANGRGGEWVCQ